MAQLPSGSEDDRKKVHIRRFSVDDVGFFEGPEKLLEVWFHLPPQAPTEVELTTQGDQEKMKYSSRDVNAGLRIIPRYVCFCMIYIIDSEVPDQI